MANFYCEYCGSKYSSVSSLTSCSCFRHPDGPNKGKHKLYYMKVLKKLNMYVNIVDQNIRR